ncbi:MAG: M28 family peptidase [Candidatus Rokubacteria bacterium]|nr:M28 family peptidase [Candidatus Rokubacteria bacterium]MBI2552913.1 M28 family peptidase [Candidatus Rokubacteria bacterium]
MKGAALLLAAALLLPSPVAAGSAFDGGAAFAHVERLVGFGPRPAGSEALARARRYIVGELKKVGVRVSEQPFTAQTPDGPIPMVNVIAELPGRRPEVILVGGHYDTKFFSNFAFVGANDGGSSSGLLLELARALAQRPREFTYWIVFFDGEEARRDWSATDGIYGSRHLAESLQRDGRARQLKAVVVVDMIGDRRLDIRREANSTPWLTDLLWGSARRLGYRAHFLDETLAVEDDHAPFLRAGIPSALLIDFDYDPYWHTAEDTLDKLSPRSLQVVGDVLLDALPALETLLRRGEPGGRAR